MQRVHAGMLVIGLAGLSWLGMMAVHELGHVMGAWVTGGRVTRVVLHPLALSRTDVTPNPHPLIETWSGPLVGVLLPAALVGIVWRRRDVIRGMVMFFAGFCLIANGVYVGAGAIDPVGDAADLLHMGTPRWLMLAFGLFSTLPGLWLWHRASPSLGLGKHSLPVQPRHAYVTFALAVAVLILGCLFGRA